MHPISIQDKDLLWYDVGSLRFCFFGLTLACSFPTLHTPHHRRYRFYLTREKRALTKVMRATDWSNPAEAKQAIEVMEQWETIEIEDALELLGKDIQHPAPRRYAVQRLEQVRAESFVVLKIVSHKPVFVSPELQADNEELGLYLLQLVQAIRYEPKYAHRVAGGPGSSPLGLQRAPASADERRSSTGRQRQVSESSSAVVALDAEGVLNGSSPKMRMCGVRTNEMCVSVSTAFL